MDLERIAQTLEDAYTRLDVARARHKDATVEYRQGWIGGYRAMLIETGYAVAADRDGVPLRPVHIITLSEATPAE